MADQMSVANSQITKLAQKLRAEADLWNGTDAPSYVTGGITATQHVLRSVAAELEAMVSENAPTRDDVLEEAMRVCLQLSKSKYLSRSQHAACLVCHSQIEQIKNAAPQVPAMATSGAGAAGVDSRNDNALESATSVQVPVASPAVAAPVCVGVARREWGEGPDGDKDVIAFINENHLLQSLLYDLDLLPEQHMKAPRDGKAWCTIFNITNHFREAVLAARQSERNESR